MKPLIILFGLLVSLHASCSRDLDKMILYNDLALDKFKQGNEQMANYYWAEALTTARYAKLSCKSYPNTIPTINTQIELLQKLVN